MAKKSLKTLRQAQGFYSECPSARLGISLKFIEGRSRRIKKGLFITFEGPEGCGKTTHANHIYKYLKKEGYPVIFTREPGGTFVGEKIRRILLNPRHKGITSLTELLLFEANRTQIIKEIIK